MGRYTNPSSFAFLFSIRWLTGCLSVCLCSEWHLATQVMYFIAAFMILFSELYARIQMCCSDDRNTRNYAVLGILVLVSGNFALLQGRFQGAEVHGQPPPLPVENSVSCACPQMKFMIRHINCN